MTKHPESIIVTALATLLVSVLVARPVAADPSERTQPTAASTSYNHAPVTLWLLPQLGTGGLSSGRVRTNFAVSLGASGYARLDGVDVGLGASWVTEAMRGAQVTVGFNYAGADAQGAQLSVGANLAGRRVTGLQLATGFNYAGADLRGVQIATGANLTSEPMAGLQLATGFNYVPAIEGAQIALINVGGQVSGAQIGIINVGRRVKGAQIGLVNVAEDSSAPLGLINVIKNGQHHIDVWSSDSAPLNVGLKLGGRYLYSVLAVGFESSEGKQRWMAGLGLGAHLRLNEQFFLEPEVLNWQVNEGQSLTTVPNTLSSLRVIAGCHLYRNLSVYAGPTLNVLVTEVGDGEGFGLIRGTRLTAEGAKTTVRMWPGFVVGFQI